MPPTRVVTADGYRVRLDVSRQVLSLEVPEPFGGEDPPPLLPTLPASDESPVSAAALLMKSKLFDDRLMATVEVAARRGAGRFVGKADLLRSLAATLADANAPAGAATLVHAACRLGGLDVLTPDHLVEDVRAAMNDFLADQARSKPLGVYDWTPELSAVFRQDRFLQQSLAPAVADGLADAVRRTPRAADAHAACLRLNARLTNPPKSPGPLDAGKRPAFLPASRSHEVTLFESLYADRAVPAGFDLMGELIRRVRSGAVSLESAADSGWYDRQAWALEPLLAPDRMPERPRVEFGRRYQEHLTELFRGSMALARETHVKQAGYGYGGGGMRLRSDPIIFVQPELFVEPLPTHYARRAAGYRFLRDVLAESFGFDTLEQIRPYTPVGMANLPLSDQLSQIEQLFTGAAAVASRDLGMPHDEGAADAFLAWKASIASDGDVSGDVRMMVPVFYDAGRRKMKVWALLGWRTTPVDVEYRVEPDVLGIEPIRWARGDLPRVRFAGNYYRFATPVMVETYVDRLMNRDEFRRHCDRHQSAEAIVAGLRR